MFNIRAIAAADAILVQEIAFQTWPDTFKEILSEEQITYMLNWMYDLELLKKQINGSHSFYLAEWEQKPIGFLGMEHHHPDNGVAKIHKIYILPDHQGKGVGKILLDHAIDIARTKGMSAIMLNVNRFNKAVDFYAKHQFKVIREEVIDIGNGYIMDDFVMQYDLC